jgi:hypothetical protein
VVFGVVAALVGALVVPPSDASGVKRVLFALAGVGIAAVAVGAGTYACALVAAPFQQRNELRRRLAASAGMHTAALAESAARIRDLETAPVSPEHAQQLRQIAVTLKDSLDAYEPPVYGNPGDSDLLRAAFLEHFPELTARLEILESAGDALTALRTRLAEEAAALGMDRHPWTHINEIPDIVAGVISARSMQQAQDVELNSNWREVDDEVYWGGFDHGTVIIYVDNPDDAADRKRTFEQLVREADAWPEAAAIRENWDQRQEAREEAKPLLKVIANRDSITTRCQLCII